MPHRKTFCIKDIPDEPLTVSMIQPDGEGRRCPERLPMCPDVQCSLDLHKGLCYYVQREPYYVAIYWEAEGPDLLHLEDES